MLKQYALLIVLFLINSEVSAYDWGKCSSISPRMHWPFLSGRAAYAPLVHSVSFPVGTPQRNALENSFSRLSVNPAKIDFSLGAPTTSLLDNAFNGKNEVWFGNPGNNIHASTKRNTFYDITNTGDCFLIEADIIFNKAFKDNGEYEWSIAKNQLGIFGGAKASFQAIAMHETAHAAGANHEHQTPNLMGLSHGGLRSAGKRNSAFLIPGQYSTDINQKIALPFIGCDLAKGFSDVYQLDMTKKEDISVSPWKLDGQENDGLGDPYSLHRRKQLVMNAAGTAEMPRIITSADPDDLRKDPVYKVPKGSTINLNFMYDNAGRTNQPAVKRNFYLSTDDNLSPDDKLLPAASATLAIPLGAPTVIKTPVVIPASTLAGKYWLFIKLDPNNDITESNNLNNATYAVIQVS